MILLTGASGYVGKKLLRKLEERSLPVRCLARRPEDVKALAKTTEVVRGDALDPESLRFAMEGVESAYYLIHSMASSAGFEEADRRAAENFAAAAREAGVKRIVYLGGLGAGRNLSPHLRSRQEVGDLLRSSGIPVIEFRASIVIGSGSLSFEMVRALVERLPVMVTPRWVRTPSQPIAIDDVLAYLMQALGMDEGGIFEIGGPDVVSYGDLMQEYARIRGLRRWMLPVPVLTPQLSSLWLGLVTPLYAKVGKKLIESVYNDTVVTDQTAQRRFQVKPIGVRHAFRHALEMEDCQFSQTRWSTDLRGKGLPWGGMRIGNRLVESRATTVPYPPERAFGPIRRIGGETGWYYGNFLWKLRGWIDRLLGGVGLRRGRSDPERLAVGDHLDFWLVERYAPNELLRLSAQMKLPGRAWLQFEVNGDSMASNICQTAIFDPKGVLGLIYWYALYPIHRLIFSRMLQRLAEAI
jgi:uncharacterized protein YbjT (DUF2867 family)